MNKVKQRAMMKRLSIKIARKIARKIEVKDNTRILAAVDMMPDHLKMVTRNILDYDSSKIGRSMASFFNIHNLQCTPSIYFHHNKPEIDKGRAGNGYYRI